MQQQHIRDILTFLHRSKKLESVQRYHSTLRHHRNTVAEHSWRLGLMVYMIGTECRVPIDIGHAVQLAIIHDLAEAKTGDADAYDERQGGEAFLAQKAQREDVAMHSLTEGLALEDSMYTLWREFEAQATKEAKFVKALDRIEGYLHIEESGANDYMQKDFHADYANGAVQAFEHAVRHFPELSELLDEIKEDLRAQFEKKGIAWIEA